MASPFTIAAPRAFRVTIEAGVARYRQTETPRFAGADWSATGQSMRDLFDSDRAKDVETTAQSVLAELRRAHSRREIAPWVPLASVLVLYFATIGALGLHASTIGVVATVVSTLGAMAALYGVLRQIDRARGQVFLIYDLDEDASDWFKEIQRALKRLDGCTRVWHVATEGRTYESHKKFGAKLFLRRYRIRPSLTHPPHVMTNLRVPSLYGERRKYFFLPDRVLAFDDRRVDALDLASLGMRVSEVLCIEDEDVPSDARVVESTWLHVTADGAPDPAIANNRRYPVVLYGELEFAGLASVRELFQFSQPDAANDLVAMVESSWNRDAEEPDDDDAEEHGDEPEADSDDDTWGELYDEALRAVVRAGFATLELLVKELGLPHGRAAVLVNRMEEDGYVGPLVRHKPRVIRRAAIRYVEVAFGRSSNGGEKRDYRSRSTKSTNGRWRRTVSIPVPRRPAYVVLGVAPDASASEITTAYHELAMLYHPDKVASLAPEFRDLAEIRMKEINAAYTELLRRS